MYHSKIIEEKTFTLCLGKNGGYMQIGGVDEQGNLEEKLTWASLIKGEDFKIGLKGVMMNDHLISGSAAYNVGFIDSGTTFTYFPSNLYKMLKIHFDWFCN